MEISCDELHEGGLPSSTRSDESSLFSLFYREGEVIEYFGFVVGVGDVLNNNFCI